MAENSSIKSNIENIEMAMKFSKCRKCGCMKESLETMKNKLLETKNNDFSELLNEVENSIGEMESIKYTWLGCKHCWSADITNAFDESFSELNIIHSIENNLVNTDDLDILPAVGEYHIL